MTNLPTKGEPPLLSAQGLRVAFVRFALGPIDVAVHPGERVALLGANGSGKSTLLNALAGRIMGYEGHVQLLEQELRDDFAAARSAIGMLPERVVAYEGMTVADYLRLHAEFFVGWDAALVADLVARLKLDPSLLMAKLSRGTRVKVAFVAAEGHRPLLLLLDEPTSGLDPMMRDEVMVAVRTGLDAATRRTMIFSTHLLEDAVEIADRVIIISDGRLVLDSPLATVTAGGDPVTRLREALRDAT